MRNTQQTELRTRKSTETFEEILNAIQESLCNIASSNDKKNGEEIEHDEKDSALGKLSEDDKPSWVMGTASNTMQQPRESFRQNQMRYEKLTQPGLRKLADNIHGRDTMNCMTELNIPAVILPKAVNITATPAPTEVWERIETPDIISQLW
jgi:hypothetical protein